MLCTNGPNNSNQATTCGNCGITTFQNPVIAAAGHGETNGLAVASMVLGIVWIYGIGSILALVFGYKAKRQIRESGQRGSGMATAGIVLGWVGIAGVILFITFWIVAIHSLHFPNNPQFGQ